MSQTKPQLQIQMKKKNEKNVVKIGLESKGNKLWSVFFPPHKGEIALNICKRMRKYLLCQGMCLAECYHTPTPPSTRATIWSREEVFAAEVIVGTVGSSFAQPWYQCVCVWIQSHSHLLWEGSQEKQPNLVSYLVRHLLCFFKFGWNTTFPSCTFIFCHLIHLYRQHENSLIIIQFKMISGFTEKKNTICILTYKTFFLLVVVVVTTCILLTATCGKVTGRNRL